MMRVLSRAAAVLMALAVAGCTAFDSAIKATFVNDENEYITAEIVECKDEEHITYIEGLNGAQLPFKSSHKARVTMPGGSRFIGYEVLSSVPSGVTYLSNNERWIYWVQGPICRVYARGKDEDSGYDLVFEGELCAQSIPKGAKKSRKDRGERVYNSPREHGDTFRTDGKRGAK